MKEEYRLFHDRARGLPLGVGYVSYEVILPKTETRTCGWLKGTSDNNSLTVSAAEVARITNPFANEQRVGLIRALYRGIHTFRELSQVTGMTNGRLQHHLKELALSNLLKHTSERNHYELSEHGQALLLLFCHIARWEPAVAGEEYLMAETIDEGPYED